MSLAGLLSILDDDPQLRDVVARAGTGPDLADTDLVAPPALRPVLAAALAAGGRADAQGQRASGFVLPAPGPVRGEGQPGRGTNGDKGHHEPRRTAQHSR